MAVALSQGERRWHAGFSQHGTDKRQGGESGIDTVEIRDIWGGADREVNHLHALTDRHHRGRTNPGHQTRASKKWARQDSNL
jgi:hypothetical protein